MLAQRLEQLAEPGGVVVQGSVYETVPERLPLEFASLGECSLKGFDQAVRAFVVRVGSSQHLPGPETVGIAALVDKGDESPRLELPARPSIAALPFTNMSGDPEQDYFSDGITEDIITALSRSPWLFVIARNSSFSYRGSNVDAMQAARELGVRYILEGSVRRASQRVRVTAQLVDGLSGGYVWGEKYDGDLTEIFELQDEITRNVVATITTQIRMHVGDIVTPERLKRPDVRIWELLARIYRRFYEMTDASLVEAEEMARKAVEIDAASCDAHHLLAGVLIHRVHMGHISDVVPVVDEAYALAKRAVALDTYNEYAYWSLGLVEMWRGTHDDARAAFERAIELNPNCSLAYGSLGTVLSFAGESDESVAFNQIAIRSNPLDLSIFYRFSGIAVAHFVAGRYEEASQWARKSVQRKPSWRVAHAVLASSLAHLGRVEEARRAIADYIEAIPEASIAGLQLPFKHKRDAERLIEGLRIGGLPE